MADLFKKLSVLIQAGLNEAIPEAINPGTPHRRRLSPERLGKHIDRELATLRERVNDAVAYEQKLVDQVAALDAEVKQWDTQADAALQRGDENGARYAVEQFKRAERRLEMAQSDLNAHRLVTQELIQRVNQLDAVVADSRAAQDSKLEQRAAEAEASVNTASASVADVLRQAREKIGAAGRETPMPTAPVRETGKADTDDDLERRRQRLSKP